jgi:hypothetical protein
MRTERTSDDLKKCSCYLYYEVSMLESLARVLATGALGSGPLNNAVLEAFIIHVRAVIDFLYVEKPRPDDIVAEDFLPEEKDWARLRPPLTPALQLAKSRAGKEIAHLTYARLDVTPEAKPWAFSEIASDVSLALDVFLQFVPREILDARWQNGVPA